MQLSFMFYYFYLRYFREIGDDECNNMCIKVYFTDIKIKAEKFQGFLAKILNKTKNIGTENNNT